MKNTVKLTLADVLNKKLQKDSTKIKYKDIYVSKLGGELTFQIPSDDETCDIVDKVNENQGTKHIKEVYTEMIYKQCAMLHEKELLETYSIVVGFDLVPIMFSVQDIMNVGNEIIEATGFGAKEEEIKN